MIAGELAKVNATALLIVGLDNTGKTTLAKGFKEIPEGAYEYYTTTPFINIEKIDLP